MIKKEKRNWSGDCSLGPRAALVVNIEYPEPIAMPAGCNEELVKEIRCSVSHERIARFGTFHAVCCTAFLGHFLMDGGQWVI